MDQFNVEATTCEESLRPWAHLPAELLKLISGNVTDIIDYIQFRSVCMSWRFSARLANLSSQLPLLLLPRNTDSDTISLFNLSNCRVSTSKFPEIRDKIICGSSFGWLALISIADSSVSLFNPFTRAQIQLPPPSDFPYYLGPSVSCYIREPEGNLDESDSWVSGLIQKGYPWKVSLSTSPYDDDCIVAVTLSCAAEFAFCRIGDETWTVENTGLPWPNECVVLNEGRLYIFDDYAACRVLDISSCIGSSVPSPDIVSLVDKFYVVRMETELVMVLTYKPFDLTGQLQHVPKLRIFKLEDTGEAFRWIEIKSIGDFVIFLSAKYSTAIRAVNVPECKEDCIYFKSLHGSNRSENCQPGVNYMDVFDIKENKYKQISCPGLRITEGLRNATWITPSF